MHSKLGPVFIQTAVSVLGCLPRVILGAVERKLPLVARSTALATEVMTPQNTVKK